MYFKIIELFLLKTLFNKGEYTFTSSNFNPFKIMIILILVGNLFFTVKLIINIDKLYNNIEKTCPGILGKPVINIDDIDNK